MAIEYYTILTKKGLEKTANPATPITLKEIAVGDGNGAYYEPVESQTALKREVWRGNINLTTTNPDNTKQIISEVNIPSTSGPFTIRELGLFDTVGDLIAIGKYPETVMTARSSGSVKDLIIRMVVEFANAAAVNITIDPNIAVASRNYVLQQKAEINEGIAQQLAQKVNYNEVRTKDEKIEPEDWSERALALATGQGTVNLLSIPQPGSVTLETMELNLKESVNSLLSMISMENDFWAVDLFNPRLVKQGSVTGTGFNDNPTRTYLYPVKVKPSTDYYVLIPHSEIIRVRNVFSTKDGTTNRLLVGDGTYRGIKISVPNDVNEIAISFCKANPDDSLSVQETLNEQIIIKELVYKNRNFFDTSLLKQGGILGDGTFSTSATRVYAYPMKLNELSVYEITTNSPTVRIRSVALYKGDVFLRFAVTDGVRDVANFSIPYGVDRIAVAFCKTDTNAILTVEETASTPITIKEAF